MGFSQNKKYQILFIEQHVIIIMYVFRHNLIIDIFWYFGIYCYLRNFLNIIKQKAIQYNSSDINIFGDDFQEIPILSCKREVSLNEILNIFTFCDISLIIKSTYLLIYNLFVLISVLRAYHFSSMRQLTKLSLLLPSVK